MNHGSTWDCKTSVLGKNTINNKTFLKTTQRQRLGKTLKKRKYYDYESEYV